MNNKVAKPDTILRDGDRVENVVHRHEPPVTAKPVKVLLHDTEREFIVVDKPGSIVRSSCSQNSSHKHIDGSLPARPCVWSLQPQYPD